MRYSINKGVKARDNNDEVRFKVVTVVLVIIALIFTLRLGKFQILDREMYIVLASDQHDLQSKIVPNRGRILIKDEVDGQLYPLAANRDAWSIYAVPKNMDDGVAVAHALSPLLGVPDVDLIETLTKDPEDPYEPLAKDIPIDVMNSIKELDLPGIGFTQTIARLYPEKNMGGQIVGLVTPDDQGVLIGRYGVEYSFQDLLAGRPGTLVAEKDRQGRRLIFAQSKLREAIDGSDVILTLDRSIQFQACEKIKNGVLEYGADRGSLIVMDVKSGAILGMCNYPDFDPNDLSDIDDVAVFNNTAVYSSYEPGSVFKAFTMAAGIEEGKVNPNTTYEDKGFEEIDDFKIKNADGLAHGIKTMTDVLIESLNTGSIFVQRQLGSKVFREYVQKFGFGERTGIKLRPQSAGDISSLENKGEIWAATASYGQGIMVTPIQLVAAFGALANNGILMNPYIVSEIVHPDGQREKTEPTEVRQVISSKTSQLITRMLVSVVEGKQSYQAGVDGYWVAGKTGTAQVAKQGSRGYETDKVITSFIGYAPADDPKFVVLVRIDNPRTSGWAGSTAAPIFGEMSKYLFQYFNIKPSR